MQRRNPARQRRHGSRCFHGFVDPLVVVSKSLFHHPKMTIALFESRLPVVSLVENRSLHCGMLCAQCGHRRTQGAEHMAKIIKDAQERRLQLSLSLHVSKLQGKFVSACRVSGTSMRKASASEATRGGESMQRAWALRFCLRNRPIVHTDGGCQDQLHRAKT